MQNPGLLQIELELNTCRQLFEAPELDPLNGVVDDRSGIEQILDELKAKPAPRAIQVTCSVADEHYSKNWAAECRTALAGYCSARIRQLARDQAAIFRKGVRALQIGLVFWGGCLLLSIFFFAMENLPPFISHFLGEGFLIAGWVALWYPTEILLFERWELARERRYYERLQNVTLQIRPHKMQADKTA
jgi:hypothetical protein